MKTHRKSSRACAVFETIRQLEKGHIAFEIKRLRPAAITITATIVGERLEIDVFEDDHIEIARFRGDEGIEGGMELLLDIVAAELSENYPDELAGKAAE